ncbi:MAG: flagellar hook-associated family protein [Roseiarcus sp.]|jgi:flagellar hook-associated protein 3 FlgL
MTESISTNYLSTSLALSIMKMQSGLATAQTESATGQYADIGLQLGAQAGQEISLQNENGLLQTYTTTNSVVATRLSTTQSALTSLQTDAQSALNALAEWTPLTYSGTSLQNLGANNLQSLTATANTSVDGQYVFGGINSGVAPMTNYFAAPNNAQTAIRAAFSSYLAGLSPAATPQTVTAGQMQTFLASPAFTSQFQGAAWTSNWSSASSANISSNISPSETVDTSTNLNQPGFQDLTQAYTMMNEFTGTSINAAAMQSVVTAASGLVSNAMNSLTSTAATLGAVQQRVTDSNTNMSAQMTILQTQVNDLDSVNAYQTATRVSALTTQIQTAYSLTAALQKLSLVNYL